ncbi:MAG: hypothetical protein CL843_05815 [Crocinitomicaceae bacterium]|nr:hypothetical protein [Crocinitomicaceae bacterium]|tara:strand:- start:63 stop:266 length:204 start_codon:yes stop_codon:yes gene_type:complete
MKVNKWILFFSQLAFFPSIVLAQVPQDIDVDANQKPGYFWNYPGFIVAVTLIIIVALFILYRRKKKQ